MHGILKFGANCDSAPLQNVKDDTKIADVGGLYVAFNAFATFSLSLT